MLRRLCLLFLTCLLLTACSFDRSMLVQKKENEVAETKITEEEAPIFDFSETNLNIAAIGDSLTKGVGDETKNGGYRSFLLNQMKMELGVDDIAIHDYGKKGLTSSGLVKNVQKPEVKELIATADVIVITIGGNDIMTVAKENFMHLQLTHFQDEMNQYEENVRAVLDYIRSNNEVADIYLVGLYNPFQKWFQDIKEFDEIMLQWNNKSRQITESYDDVYFVEIANLFMNDTENLIYEEDFFHPNHRGYELMGEAIFEELKENTFAKIQM